MATMSVKGLSVGNTGQPATSSRTDFLLLLYWTVPVSILKQTASTFQHRTCF